MNEKVFTESEKGIIRNKWCDQLCHIFNTYFKNKVKPPITTPLYTAQVISTFGLIDFKQIDFTERRINIMTESRTSNENLIFECFDKLIENKLFIGDYMNEFRNYYQTDGLPW